MKYYFTFFSFLFISICGFSQEVDEKEQVEKLEKIKAVVINAQDASVLESVHIINLNKVVGTITNEKGEFSISAAVNDTLYFSYLGFKPQKVRVTNDMFKFKDTKIALTELA